MHEEVRRLRKVTVDWNESLIETQENGEDDADMTLLENNNRPTEG